MLMNLVTSSLWNCGSGASSRFPACRLRDIVVSRYFVEMVLHKSVVGFFPDDEMIVAYFFAAAAGAAAPPFASAALGRFTPYFERLRRRFSTPCASR